MFQIAFKAYIRDFFALIYPQLCVGCGSHLHAHEKQLCEQCLQGLPYTNEDPQHHYLANQLMAHQPVSGVYSLCYFNRGSAIEQCIHHLKYKGRTDLGVRMGTLLAAKLKHFVTHADVIVPVPLHPRKEAKRGYNQSLFIAKGLSEQLNVSLNKTSLVRVKNTTTQTNKSRAERFQSMAGAFQVQHKTAFAGKHVVLVDDVITTGSTILACTEQLFLSSAKSVFLVSVGKADLF